MLHPADLTSLLSTVYTAGAEILKIYNEDFGVKYKDDNSPITEADRRAHTLILSGLDHFHLPVLSEEGNIPEFTTRKNWQRYWLVDPLDGTKEFVSRNGEFTVNIALIENGNPIFGVVYTPVLDVCYYADENIGAFRIDRFSEYYNDKKTDEIFNDSIRLPKQLKDKTTVIVASRSHMNDETNNFIVNIEKEKGLIKLVSRGSSLKLCMIAEGSADIYPRYGRTMEWDIAAGHAVIRYAGKDVKDAVTGQSLVYNKEDISNPYFIAM
jgi:3'(2'), 5'-bisphosphate nucleotidase